MLTMNKQLLKRAISSRGQILKMTVSALVIMNQLEFNFNNTMYIK